MSEAKVRYRRPLNEQQITALYFMYRFRFCTSKQLAILLKKDSSKAIQNKLQILEEQQLIGKHYDKSYKLAGRSAEYFVTPMGARALEKAKPDTTNKWAMKSLYKNKTVSSDFLKHCITVVDTSLQLKAVYGDRLSVSTRSYMAQYSTYPAWVPDLHLRFRPTANANVQHYFLDVWDGTRPFFVTVRKVQSYVQFKEKGEWLNDTPFPAVLAICEDKRTQTKLNRQMKRILSDVWDDELVFATTTKQLLEEAAMPAGKIWLKIDADDEPAKSSLRSLFVTS